MNKYYFTFGSDPMYPYCRGWVEILAETLQAAIEKFRKHFPDRHEGIVNCAFWYTEKDFWGNKGYCPEGEYCHEVIY